MLAWITYQPRGLPRVRHHIQLLCGLPLCRVEIGGHPSVLLRLLLRREGHALREAGIREGAWAEDLPSWGQMDLRPVDIAPLRRAVLPSLLACAFQQKHPAAPPSASPLRGRACRSTGRPSFWRSGYATCTWLPAAVSRLWRTGSSGATAWPAAAQPRPWRYPSARTPHPPPCC